MNKRTKIIATLGPSSDDVITLEKMLNAGMNVARLNFSHGSYDHMKKVIKNLREASVHANKPVAILQDLQGPKIRVGELPQEGILLEKGEIIIFSTDGQPYRNKPHPTIPVQYQKLHEDVHVGDEILLDDGYLEARVTRIKDEHIFCTIKTGGILKSHKGINCPTASISAKTITSKDKKDLAFGLKQGIDYVALSFVRGAADIEALRFLLVHHKHPEVKIIAKIERHEAIKDIEAIVAASDAVMVARGDLGIEIPAEHVPLVQKEIIHWALLYGKPVIIATQVLESMIQNPRATRAEISDAASAVFDHADAIMLSAETSVGKYPVAAVRTLSRVARATEHEMEKKTFLLHNHLFEHDMPITDATCYNAALLAEQIEANHIVVITKSGYTAEQIMKHRPRTPVTVITQSAQVKRQLELVWGLDHTLVSDVPFNNSNKKSTQLMPSQKVEAIITLLRKQGGMKTNEEVVIVNAGKRNNFITTIVL